MECAYLQESVLDCAKLLLAALCAAVIGWERQRLEKAAGLRTHVLISVGACLFTITGMKFISPSTGGELLRVFQGIATGVGFVGAGAIIHQGENIKGITTASGIWVISAIGMTIGAGEFTIAIFGTLVTYVVLHVLGYLEARWSQNKDERERTQ